MKKLLIAIVVFISISFSAFANEDARASVSADRFYKQTVLDVPANGTKDIASIPVTYDLSSVKSSYVKMGFSSTDPLVSITDLGASVALKGSAETGRIDGFDKDVYAYCRVISSVPVAVAITGLAPLECDQLNDARDPDDGLIDWQVYSIDESGGKIVYFNGLNGKYIVPAVQFLKHTPLSDGKIESVKSAHLSIESESFRGKVIGNYSSELIMTITSIN